VTGVTAARAGSGKTLTVAGGGKDVMKTIFLGFALAFAFATGMALTTIISQIVS
jgi:hypothetical protein